MLVQGGVWSGPALETEFLLGSISRHPLPANFAKGSGRLRFLPEVRQQGSSRGGVQGQSGLTPSQGERGCWSWRKIDDVRKDVRSEVDGGGDGC